MPDTQKDYRYRIFSAGDSEGCLLLMFNDEALAVKRKQGERWVHRDGSVPKPMSAWSFLNWMEPEEVTALKLQGVI